MDLSSDPLATGKPRIGVTAGIYLEYMMMYVGFIMKAAIGMIN
jgi:hypothetical protein